MTDTQALIPPSTITFWQEKLRLMDWQITVEVHRLHDLDGCMGRVEIDHHMRIALIKLMDPADEPAVPNLLYPYRPEEVLVHELLHIPLADWVPDGEAEEANHEWAINSLVGALMGLKQEPSPQN
ncbi:MAG: hypothetical protein AAFX78_04945 [Cyanobacteria bacterium J06638_20]